MSDLSELQRSLGRVEGKLDTLISRMDGHEKQVGAHVDDHEKRIGELEKSHRYFSGWMGAIGVIAGAALTWILNALGVSGAHGVK